MKPKPTDSQTAPAIRFKVNVIAPASDAPGGARFVPAGEPSPYDDIAEVPDHLRPFIVTDDEPEVEEESRANFELGVTYQVNSDGRLGRVVARQIAQLEAQAEQEAWAEEQLSAPLAPEIADALEAQNDQHVGKQMAQAEAEAKRRDQTDEAAQRFIDEEVNEL